MELKPSLKLLDLISLQNEPWLEKWARLFRYAAADPFVEVALQEEKTVTIVDFGCGPECLYYTYLQVTYPQDIHRIMYVGVDPLLPKEVKKKNFVTIKSKFEKIRTLPKADIIVMFAVLEHVDNASELLRTASRFLKKNGQIIGTTPSPLARLPLEFFCYILGIIAKREIDEHKRYPTRSFILSLQSKMKDFKICQSYFELGLNNLFIVKSNKQSEDLPAYSLQREAKVFQTIVSRVF